MSGNAILFIEIKNKGQGSATFANKGIDKIIGLDKIDKGPSNSIDNIYLVDALKFSIIMISQPCDEENLVSFDSAHCMVQNKKSRKLTLYGPTIENMYAIDINDIPLTNLACFNAS